MDCPELMVGGRLFSSSSMCSVMEIIFFGTPITFATCCSQWSSRSRSTMRFRYKTVRRSEEHTSELQSQSNLVCRLLLEKKKRSTRSTSRCPYASHRQPER